LENNFILLNPAFFKAFEHFISFGNLLKSVIPESTELILKIIYSI